jgi:hypothetical protein
LRGAPLRLRDAPLKLRDALPLPELQGARHSVLDAESSKNAV